jgi:5-bromo-4-chloroindolyl phosphate hydrolysis protein
VPHISLRIEQELYDKIEGIRGEEDRTTYIKKILVAHIEAQNTASGTQGNTSSTHGNTDSNIDVAHLESEIEYLKNKLDEAGQEKQNLMKLLNQEQSLHLQTQRQLMPTPEEITKKAWWKFWKK